MYDHKAPILSEIISEYAKKIPESNAINDGTNSYGFAELENISDNLAELIIEKYNIKKGPRILFIAEKASEIVVGIIGTWKAGAAFVPVDKNNGVGRTQFIVENVTPSLIISSREMLEKFAEAISDIPTLSYEEIAKLDKTESNYSHSQTPDGDDIAIILHTSGSTGNPKGAVLQHKSVVAYFRAHNEAVYGFKEHDKNINYGPYHFDVSIQDTFLPLYFGASVYIYRGLFISGIIIALMLKEGATHITAVSSVLALISGTKDELTKLRDSPLRVIQTGGEICDTKLINKWLTTHPNVKIYNGYGPTECNSLCMAHEITEADPDRNTLFPIGKAFPGTTVALINQQQQVISQPGVVGTLLVAGPQLMEGYWNLPEQTEKAFFFIEGERYYITGDLARFDESGNYYFEGRNDSEVKILGRRINLNEIRDCLLKMADADYAVVGTINMANSTYIYAFIYQSEEKKMLTREKVIDFMRGTLPEYMIPKYVIISNEIFKTSTNKINEQEIKKNVEGKILAAEV
jgi:D-alanine--poly(phosphoribitol) ligase subunit 1